MSTAESLPAALSRRWGAAADQVVLPANALGISSGSWTLPVRSPLVVPALPQHRLIANLAPLESHRIWVDGRLLRSGPSERGAMRIAPPGETGRAEVAGARLQFAQVYLPAAALASAQDGRSSSPLVGLKDPRFDAGDSVLFGLITTFLAGQAEDVLYGEHVALAIATHLVSNYGISSGRRSARCERLHPRVARRIEEYVEAHLDEPLTVGLLAHLAQLSEFHFTRAFAGTFGVPPYQFVKGRRISRAQALLLDPDRSIADTALACGFSSQPAFTTAFKQRMGLTPHAWRTRW